MVAGRTSLQLVLLDNNEQIESTDAHKLVDQPMRFLKSIDAILSTWPQLSSVSTVNRASERVDLLLKCCVPEAHWIVKKIIGNRPASFAVCMALEWISYCSLVKKGLNNFTTVGPGIR